MYRQLNNTSIRETFYGTVECSSPQPKDFLDDIQKHLPKTFSVLERILNALQTGDVQRAQSITATHYKDLESISIDYGIMEKLDDVLTISGNFGWSDVGSWNALADIRTQTKKATSFQNMQLPPILATILFLLMIPVLFLSLESDDLIVVKAGDAILVAQNQNPKTSDALSMNSSAQNKIVFF